MKLSVLFTPSMKEVMHAEYRAGEKAVTRTMRAAAVDLKAKWRGQITSAGLGRKLGNAVRSASYPARSESMNAAAMVWTRAPKITAAHEAGPLIRSASGFFLAIPTPAAGVKAGGARMTPGEWEKRRGLRLRFVYRRGRPSLLVAESRLNTRGSAVASRSKTGRGVATVPIFILVPQVRLKKRLDLIGAAQRIGVALPGQIVANWRDA